MIDVTKILKEQGGLHKFGGVAPEGFVLIHEKTLDELKNFDVWIKWSENKLSLIDLDKRFFTEDK
jgi:hypothetical protein